MYSILSHVWQSSPFETIKNAIQTITSTQGRRLNIISIGGGPGTDAAGLIWFNRHFLNGQIDCCLMDYEGSWKRYLTTLSSLFAPDVSLTFAHGDITTSLYNQANIHFAKARLQVANIFVFSYVCRETSQASAAQDLIFYRDLAKIAPLNSVFIFADVMRHCDDHFSAIASAMMETLNEASLGKNHDHHHDFCAEDFIAGTIQTIAVSEELQRQLKSSIALALKRTSTKGPSIVR